MKGEAANSSGPCNEPLTYNRLTAKRWMVSIYANEAEAPPLQQSPPITAALATSETEAVSLSADEGVVLWPPIANRYRSGIRGSKRGGKTSTWGSNEEQNKPKTPRASLRASLICTRLAQEACKCVHALWYAPRPRICVASAVFLRESLEPNAAVIDRGFSRENIRTLDIFINRFSTICGFDASCCLLASIAVASLCRDIIAVILLSAQVSFFGLVV